MNIEKIAELAGVSRAAVSRYFNNGYISDQKREAIRKVVEETGYRPSVQAQTLRTKKTKMIGVIAPKIASFSVGKVMEGILSVIYGNGYRMLLAVTQNDPKKELEYLGAFGEKQVDGVILLGAVFQAEHKRMLKNLSVPVVIVGQQLPGYNCVFHDDYQAFYDLTRLMLDKGRRKLGYIGAIRQDTAVGEKRYRAFRDALQDMGQEELAKNCVAASFTVRSGYEKAGELLDKCKELDGLVCATDTIAAGAAQYLREHGIKIPEQVLVAGQGDSDMARAAVPSLVTVHYSYEESGETAVRMLLDVLAAKEGRAAFHEKKTASEGPKAASREREIPCREVKMGYYIVEPRRV